MHTDETTSPVERTHGRELLIAFGVGFAGAVIIFAAACAGVALTGGGDEAMILVLPIWFILPCILGHVSGRLLSRWVDRSSMATKVVLATPMTPLVLFGCMASVVMGGPFDILSALAVSLPSFALTAVGFHFSPHAPRPRNLRVCRKCGYDLRGTVSEQCSECGTPLLEVQREKCKGDSPGDMTRELAMPDHGETS